MLRCCVCGYPIGNELDHPMVCTNPLVPHQLQRSVFGLEHVGHIELTAPGSDPVPTPKAEEDEEEQPDPPKVVEAEEPAPVVRPGRRK